jgi:hypothetical protein
MTTQVVKPPTLGTTTQVVKPAMLGTTILMVKRAMNHFALYQGATSVAPRKRSRRQGFSPWKTKAHKG